MKRRRHTRGPPPAADNAYTSWLAQQNVEAEIDRRLAELDQKYGAALPAAPPPPTDAKRRAKRKAQRQARKRR
jgi:hypothetical protein